jgi:hypothetical protein
VKYHYVREYRVGWFDAFAPAFAINGDDRRAVPGIVRPMERGERRPEHSAGNVGELKGNQACVRELAGSVRQGLALVGSTSRSEEQTARRYRFVLTSFATFSARASVTFVGRC